MLHVTVKHCKTSLRHHTRPPSTMSSRSSPNTVPAQVVVFPLDQTPKITINIALSPFFTHFSEVLLQTYLVTLHPTRLRYGDRVLALDESKRDCLTFILGQGDLMNAMELALSSNRVSQSHHISPNLSG